MPVITSKSNALPRELVAKYEGLKVYIVIGRWKGNLVDPDDQGEEEQIFLAAGDESASRHAELLRKQEGWRSVVHLLQISDKGLRNVSICL